MRHSKRDPRGFTLIELLVVVAIIALLVAILLPSLAKARKQARTTLCASRMGQLTKAFLIYSEDFAETPPFMGTGYENIRDVRPNSGKKYWGEWAYDWAVREDWLIPHMPDCWLQAEQNWPADSKVSNGSLFKYARFEGLYRCPEFERIGLNRKAQNVFNYTRGITARKALSNQAPISDPDATGTMGPGPIMKPSMIYSPGTLWMLFDEQWDFHCALPLDQQHPGGKAGDDLPAAGIYNFWMGYECIQTIAGDMLGSYHANSGKKLNFNAIKASEMGNLSYYDGHVALYRDPLPYRGAQMGSDFYDALYPAAVELGNLLMEQIFAQRGINLTTDDLVRILQGLISL